MKKHFWIHVDVLTVLSFLVWGILAAFWFLSNPGMPKPTLEIPVKFSMGPMIPITGWAGVVIGIALILVAGVLTHVAEKTHRESHHHPTKITKLNTTGLYTRIRHPIYLGGLFMNFDIAFLFRSLWMFVLVIFFCLLGHFEARQEEKYLIEKFGEEYIQYKARTGMFLPRIGKPHGST